MDMSCPFTGAHRGGSCLRLVYCIGLFSTPSHARMARRLERHEISLVQTDDSCAAGILDAPSRDCMSGRDPPTPPLTRSSSKFFVETPSVLYEPGGPGSQRDSRDASSASARAPTPRPARAPS